MCSKKITFLDMANLLSALHQELKFEIEINYIQQVSIE